MSKILNLGVLAHVDAGKTSLTERILYSSGTITSLGSVDSGTTQTDTLALEQQRGITIRASVASLAINGIHINLIDTPGHPDFIAEVERSLAVLDAVILVVSSVEGVQPQTRRLARAITTIGLPCIIFCNKIDRASARYHSLLNDLESKLGWNVVSLSTVADIGSLEAISEAVSLVEPSVVEPIAERDDEILERWLEAPESITVDVMESTLVRLAKAGDLVPVIFGSAITGAGIEHLLELLPDFAPVHPISDLPLSAEVFKIERDRNGERVVLARIWSGTMHARESSGLRREGANEPIPGGKITRIARSTPGGMEMVQAAAAGEIVRIYGLADARIGDVLGSPPPHPHRRLFSPVFETVIREQQPEQRHDLQVALTELADQDPFIAVRFDQRSGTTSVRLFGDVQKEVIEDALVNDFAIRVNFAESTVICIERPLDCGESVEHIGGDHPFVAGVGLRVAPGEKGSGVRYQRSKESLGKTRPAFYQAIEETVYSVLGEGLHGWEVTDILIELTYVAFVDSTSTAGDFRALTPLVLMAALQQAGTEVCEPLHAFRLQIPEDSLARAVRLLIPARAMIAESVIEGELAVVTGEIPAAEVPAFERSLPGISRGEGDFDYWHSGWQPVSGDPPSRPRSDQNPLDRTEYLSRLSGRFQG